MTDTPDTEHDAIADLVAALGELEEPSKAGKVNAGARKYTYLTLPDLISAVRPVLAKHRLAFHQDVTIGDRTLAVVTTILHASGEYWQSSPLELPCGRAPQEVGSALTYARRYSLATMVGLAGADDDDAQTAGRPRPAAARDELPPVDPQTGEILDAPPAPPRSSAPEQQPATAKQIGAIRGLAHKAGLDRDQAADELEKVTGHRIPDDLDIAGASKAVKHFQTLADLNTAGDTPA